MSRSFDELLDGIETRHDFVAFVLALSDGYRQDGDSWENSTLDRFLDALASWTEDWFDKYGEPTPPPNWKIFAQAMLAARIYE